MQGRVLVLVALVAGCTDDPIEPTENHTVVFGSGGTPSQSAAELFDKSDAMLTHDIVGVYESKGMASGLYDVPGMDGVVGIVKNNYTKRVEVRTNQIVTALRCDLVYTSPDRPGKRLEVFVSQDATLANDVYDIIEEGGMGVTDQDSFTECNLMLAREKWVPCTWIDAFPDGSYSLPSGANICVAREDGELKLHRRFSSEAANVESAGPKVAN